MHLSFQILQNEYHSLVSCSVRSLVDACNDISNGKDENDNHDPTDEVSLEDRKDIRSLNVYDFGNIILGSHQQPHSFSQIEDMKQGDEAFARFRLDTAKCLNDLLQRYDSPIQLTEPLHLAPIAFVSCLTFLVKKIL